MESFYWTIIHLHIAIQYEYYKTHDEQTSAEKLNAYFCLSAVTVMCAGASVPGCMRGEVNMSASQHTNKNKRKVDGKGRGDSKQEGGDCMVAMVTGAFHLRFASYN